MDFADFIKEYIREDPVKQTKDLYDQAYKARQCLFKSKESNVLPELIVDGFDTEQIWQQIELENNEMFSSASLEILSKALANPNWELPIKIVGETEEQSQGLENEAEEEEEEEDESDEEELGEGEPELEDSNDDSVNENTKRKPKQTSSSTKKRQKTEVDDQFFSLRQMDEYVTKVEKQEMSGEKKKKRNEDDDDDDDDDDNLSIDYFDDIPEEEEDEGSDDEIKTGRSVKYGDFFDSPDDENEGKDMENIDENDEEDGSDEEDDDYDDDHAFNDEDSNADDEVQQKRVKFNLLSGSENSDSETEAKNQEDKSENKSSLEAREERLRKKIDNLEKEAVSEKPWQLKGEATARTRPKNSLLEEYVEFDTGLRPAPIMTHKVMLKLEDIIRSRIKDKAWDDVEKKFKPVETPLEYKKKLVMNQEKSKESLAQIYENEYIRQREALTAEDKDEQDKEDTPEEIEIKERMHALFRKLDALSNFHYTPKLAKPEIKIVSNIPAISMEEVAPVATSDATLLAPEEVKGKPKSNVLGKSERTKTDKKRERRKKKLKQHNRAVYQSKKEAEDAQKPIKKNKKNSKVDASKIKGRNIINNPDSTGQNTVKSSTAFFNQLQNEVNTGIQEKLGIIKAKKKTNTLSAAKLKL